MFPLRRSDVVNRLPASHFRLPRCSATHTHTQEYSRQKEKSQLQSHLFHRPSPSAKSKPQDAFRKAEAFSVATMKRGSKKTPVASTALQTLDFCCFFLPQLKSPGSQEVTMAVPESVYRVQNALAWSPVSVSTVWSIISQVE